jgi:hypothetical protein
MVMTLGQKRVKPSAYFRPIAQITSKLPATINISQAIASPVLRLGDER